MLTMLHGDALTQLKTLESESVQTCVTSPPYWGLRDYGVDIQIGLEKTPEDYVAALVDVFREVNRVLRKDGTLWLNLGDSYAGGGGHCPNAPSSATSKSGKYGEALIEGGIKPQGYIKAKDLVGIPWMVAFALRADGWYLRSDIIWSKPNPMPESVTDRPTKSHEYIFLLSKSAKYYYDADAIKEPSTEFDWESRLERESHKSAPTAEINGIRKREMSPRTDRHRWNENNGRGFKPKSDKQRGHSRRHAGFNDRWDEMERQEQCSGMRNKRSVWEIATKPFPDAHFATFPPKLIEPCVLAGSKAGDVVLDSFAGSGTTGKVAIELGRKAILIEAKAEYVEMIERRCKTTIGLGFVTEPSPEMSLEITNEGQHRQASQPELVSL